MNYQYPCDGMLTIECQQPFGFKLDKQQASQLTQCVSRDLFAVLGIKDQTALVLCGASFTSEQLLQPKFPIQQHITQYASAAFQGQMNSDQVLSIGANEGLMPAGLEPHGTQQNLLHLPFCLYTNDRQLAEQFEASLMHKGMVSPPTYACLSELLNTHAEVQVNHANYMTYLDLVAMMHNHFDQLGWHELWQVIETALVSPNPKTAVQSATGNHFYLVDHLVFTPQFSWSQFKLNQPGSDPAAYIRWLMAQRLSTQTLKTHGLEVKPFSPSTWPINKDNICLGQFERQLINQSFWSEDFTPADDHPKGLVYHADEHAGVVAISLNHPDPSISQVHFPIDEQGIHDIEEHLVQSGGHELNKIVLPFTQQSHSLI